MTKSQKELIDGLEKKQVQREIERYRDEIEGLRRWESEEAKHGIIANIRSLNRLGITKIDLSFCYLKKAHLRDVRLNGSDLGKSNLQGANLWNASLREAIVMNSDLQGAILIGADLRGADFSGSNLREAELQDANLKDAVFYESDLRGAKFLTIRQLSETKTLFKAKLDPELLNQVKEKYPILLRDPNFV